jgi:predicted permease
VIAFVPLGFFAVGVTLAQEAEEGALPIPPPMSRPIAAALAIRLLAAPTLLLAFSAPLIHLPSAYLLQAAMPTGINTLVVAHVYGLDLKIAAGAIAWSTAIVVTAGLAAALLA